MTIKERIVLQASEMFIRSGIKAITMDDIANETGVSKRTIYEIFTDKNNLLKNCIDHMDTKFRQEKEVAGSEAKNIIDLIFSFIKIGVKAINIINPLFNSDLKKYHYQIWKETYRLSDEMHRTHIQSVIKQGVDEGVFRDNIDVEIVGMLLSEQLRIMSDEAIFPSVRFSKAVVFENIVINFFRGIATKKGLDLIENYMDKESDQFVTVRKNKK